MVCAIKFHQSVFFLQSILHHFVFGELLFDLLILNQLFFNVLTIILLDCGVGNWPSLYVAAVHVIVRAHLLPAFSLELGAETAFAS